MNPKELKKIQQNHAFPSKPNDEFNPKMKKQEH